MLGIVFSAGSTESNVDKVINIPNLYRGILISFDANDATCGMYFVKSTTNGAVSTVAIRDASGITLTKSTNTLTITSDRPLLLTAMNRQNTISFS